MWVGVDLCSPVLTVVLDRQQQTLAANINACRGGASALATCATSGGETSARYSSHLAPLQTPASYTPYRPTAAENSQFGVAVVTQRRLAGFRAEQNYVIRFECI